MSTRSLAVLAILPLFWATAALAEAPAPGADHATAAPSAADEARYHKNSCTERYAHTASRLAYLEAKLDLTDKQHPAWTKWSQWNLDAAGKGRATCLADAPKPGTTLTALDREANMEKALANTLAGLQASRPALQALYEVLTPEQRMIFDHSTGWSHHGGGHGRHHHQGR
ncbi:MAG TPA: Spy/CpxP family protein refolding chaperone [Patescibacteria group bacterium]|nr:Spy/CpxP family protein refolding chaperone [Patescibacteria group bacterium]